MSRGTLVIVPLLAAAWAGPLALLAPFGGVLIARYLAMRHA
jgi:hypothetical protein